MAARRHQAGSALHNAVMAPLFLVLLGLVTEFGWYGVQEQRLSVCVEAATTSASTSSDPAETFEAELATQLDREGLGHLSRSVLAYTDGPRLQATIALDYPGLSGFAPVPRLLERTVSAPLGG